MLGKIRGNRIDVFAGDYVVFDLETTGMSADYDRVVEISGIKVMDHKPVDEFSTLVNPGCHISSSASAVNGIYDDMVADSPRFEEVLPKFIEFIGELPLVGHNINSFDMKFIYRDSEEYLGAVPDNDFIDTLYIARRCMPELAHHRMTDLASHFHISTEGAHRALNDCRMTQQVYELLKRETELYNVGEKSAVICDKCGSRMVLRNGRFGEFWGCSSYPKCTNTKRCR